MRQHLHDFFAQPSIVCMLQRDVHTAYHFAAEKILSEPAVNTVATLHKLFIVTSSLH